MSWEEWIEAASKYLQEQWGIASNFSTLAANLFGYFWYYGLNPQITSGLRTPEKQRELQERYQRGDPSIVYPPSNNSKHLKGEAIDISTNDPSMAFKIAHALGVKTVSGDRVHFTI